MATSAKKGSGVEGGGRHPARNGSALYRMAARRLKTYQNSPWRQV